MSTKPKNNYDKMNFLMSGNLRPNPVKLRRKRFVWSLWSSWTPLKPSKLNIYCNFLPPAPFLVPLLLLLLLQMQMTPHVPTAGPPGLPEGHPTCKWHHISPTAGAPGLPAARLQTAIQNTYRRQMQMTPHIPDSWSLRSARGSPLKQLYRTDTDNKCK